MESLLTAYIGEMLNPHFMFKTNGISFCDQRTLLRCGVDTEAARQKPPSCKGTGPQREGICWWEQRNKVRGPTEYLFLLPSLLIGEAADCKISTSKNAFFSVTTT